ncbi:hypothetical protein Q7C36_011146 [Tachysurus vachellii]|uniref:Mitotic checkpoint serine/threonine-protein kinase BUB1 n=1 Tax=Tachysurus vachellii TaxID=175792 RepID=A0AA88MW77_TACVA|nr:hypothetical protein Q7C36_011146 [Tachysurus vachellii]
MDINFYVQRFESTIRGYVGDDPLSAWDTFIEFLELRLPHDEKNKLSMVMEKLIKTFLPDRHYHNDLRFINYCIRYASNHSDPVKVYSDLHDHGVGLQMAALYISWAQQCERRNLTTEVDQVYQKAFNNQAEPLDTLQHHYRLFQGKRGPSQTTPSVAVNNPLQDSQLVNQQLRQRNSIQPQCKDVVNSQFPADRSVRIISRSENNPPQCTKADMKVESMYCVSDLVCEGSELSFEELRARRYFTKVRQQELHREQEEVRRRYEEEEEEVMRMKKLLEELNSKLSVEPQLQQVTSGPHPFQITEDTPNPAGQSEPLSGPCVFQQSLTQHTDSTHAQSMQHTLLVHPEETRPEAVCVSQVISLPRSECLSHNQAQDMLKCDVLNCEEDDEDVNTDVSFGVFNHHTHITPNTSLGLNSTTPSRALPSPTVNTREALDLIGNMFQGPTLLQDSLFTTTHNSATEEDSFEKNCKVTGFNPSSVKAPSSAPFRIYQDENNENRSVDPQVEMKPTPAAPRVLMEIPVSTVNVTPQGAESLTDESTVWSSGHTPMASFPNHTQEFARSANLVSTPLHLITLYSRDTQHVECVSGENPYLRQPAKLSPILEQSPPEDKQCVSAECTPRAQGTIVGECLSLQRHTHSLSQSRQDNTTITRQVLAPLTLTEHSIAPAEELRTRTNPSWSVYQSPNEEIKKHHVSNLQCSSSREFSSISLGLGRECKPDHVNSKPEDNCSSNILQNQDQFNSSSQTSLRDQFRLNTVQCSSNRELSFHNQNPVREDLPNLLNSSRLLGELSPEKLNSSRLKIFEEKITDQAHTIQSQLSDVEEADLLLPERSFNMRKSIGLLSENPQMHQWKSFHKVPQSPDPVLRVKQDVAMSPEAALGFGWLQVESPVQTAESDLDLMLESPPQTYRPGWDVHSDQQSGILLSKRSFGKHKSDQTLFPTLNTAEKSGCVSPCRGSDPGRDVPMSPEVEPRLNWIPVMETEADLDIIMTPQQNNKTCLEMENDVEMSQKLNCDVFMSPTQPSAPLKASVLISDPWDDDLIVSLLAGLHTPLSSFPNLNSWTCSIPPITPKLSVQLGDERLRVDCVLGQGAFATVYQATNLTNSHKLILKVQKPSNPWEFYINTQLNVRVEPRARHLYNRLHAAHLYSNGSVLIGELHNCGTLLNVVNLYKSRSERVMPQPLVLYFTVCILDMVERLHAAHIIHADIKPDNFLLGERFLENKNLFDENLEHGLVLIDFGQSIDMTLFPDGAQFMAHCMTSGFQCTEMLSGRPWTYQTDYFGVAGTVYCMLFGSYMQVKNDGGVWKPSGVFKRVPHSELWQELFHVLLNVPDCWSLPCLRVLRERLSAALMTTYSTKLLGLKNRLVVQILESRPSCR